MSVELTTPGAVAESRDANQLRHLKARVTKRWCLETVKYVLSLRRKVSNDKSSRQTCVRICTDLQDPAASGFNRRIVLIFKVYMDKLFHICYCTISQQI